MSLWIQVLQHRIELCVLEQIYDSFDFVINTFEQRQNSPLFNVQDRLFSYVTFAL